MADLLAQLEMLLAQAVERPGRAGGPPLAGDRRGARGCCPIPAGSWTPAGSAASRALRGAAGARSGAPGGGRRRRRLELRRAPAGAGRLAGWLAAAGCGRGDPVAILAHRSAPAGRRRCWGCSRRRGLPDAGPRLPGAAAGRDAAPSPRPAPGSPWRRPAGPRPVRAWLGGGRLPVPGAARGRRRRPARASRLRRGRAAGPRRPAGRRRVIGFTSGSTGRPKGILGLHGSLSHFLPVQREVRARRRTTASRQLSGLAHDPLQRDIFTPLYLGAAIVVPDPPTSASPAGWRDGWRASG